MQPSSPYATFWQWFAANGERLRTMMYGQDEEAREEASAELREAVDEVEPGLVLEFSGAQEDQTRQLIVSADGRRERVDPIKDFVASADVPGWEVVAFRPRMELGDSMAIVLQGEQVTPEDIWFDVAEDEDGLNLTLHVRGLTPENERLRGLGASLLAEHAVGERDVLTLLSSLQVEPLANPPTAAGLRPFRELVRVFDAAKAAKYPPPGLLLLDPEGEWQNMQGTINDSFAMILLNAGVRRMAGHPNYDHSLTVTLPFSETSENGMPATEEEYLAVRECGDQLTGVLEEGQQSLLVLTIMTQGRLDLIFYTANAAAALRRLQEWQTKDQAYQAEPQVERDSFWGMYRTFYQAGEEPEAEE